MSYNKIMSKKRKLINVLLEILYLAIIFAYLLIVKSIYSTNVHYDFMAFMGISLFIIGISILLGSHFNKYLNLILCALYTLYLVAQKTYHRGFSSYFRFATALELGSEVADQKAAIGELFDMNDIIPFVVLLLITIIFLVLRYVFKCKTKYKWYIRLCSIACFGLAFFSINSMVKEINATYDGDNFLMYHTDFYIYDTVNNPESFVKNLGLLTYGYRDAVSLFEDKKNDDLYNEVLDEYYSSLSNVDEINDYTGLFKDKSLLVIQAESLNNFGISEELTPTLYKIKNNSIEFTNFDTPLLFGSTSDSEFMANTSFIPEAEGYSVCYQYVDNTYPLTLGNLFKNNGYRTTAFHNNYSEYYNRDITFVNYGYEFSGCYELGLEDASEDTIVSEQIAWIDAEREKFMTFWISYSGHQPYTMDGTGVTEENVSKVKEKYPNIDESLAIYIAKTMNFDQAVEYFLNVMEWMGRSDDVVIIIYGDHIVKTLDSSITGSSFVDTFGDDETLKYTPLYIYANNMEHVVVDKYCTALDLIPTIMNLWDFDYDNKYAFGNDILDPSYSGFCFDVNGNCWNNDFYYSAVDGSIVTYNGYSKEEAEKIVNDFNKKREICKETLIVDYFKEE